MKNTLDLDQIVGGFFSKKEIEEYFALPIDLRETAFFTCWTRKEAFIKAIGEGLYMPLNNFSVSPNPNRKSSIEIHNNSIAEDQWTIEDMKIRIMFPGLLRKYCWK